MAHELLNPSSRLRRSPLFDRVKGAGAKAYSVYNRTLIGQWFGTLEEDCAHLKSAVQVWDVGGQRQVEIAGPDAARLIQLSTPRDLSRMAADQCCYIPVIDAQGRMLNDPVLVKVAADRYWASIADSDLILYYKGLAAGLELDVRVFEPDVWPLAIQGPKAEELATRVFGPSVADIRFFRHARVDVRGTPMILARSGWSLQGGFELYVEGGENAGPIWERLMEEGRDLDVRAGCPNLIERIEGGLLSFGADMTMEHTPLEAGLDKYCQLDRETGCIGSSALRANPPKRRIRPVEIAGGRAPTLAHPWRIDGPDGPAGWISSAIWSPDFETNVAVAMIDRDCWEPGTRLTARTPDGPKAAVVRAEFWNTKGAGRSIGR